MKISYRTHPVLEKLERNSLLTIGMFEEDEYAVRSLMDDFKKRWKMYSFDYNKEIRYLTKPFVETFEKAKEKLAIPELFEKTPSCSGTLLIDKRAICFSFENTPDTANVTFFVFLDNVIYAYGQFFASDVTDSHNYFYWTSKASAINQNDKEALQRDFNLWISNILLLINFFKYADIETKILAPKSNTEQFHCRYVNQTKSRIQIINSTWFTNLVKSDAFKVRGHFRLQACGESLKDRKLIWINEFQKSGYTAPARKLKEEAE